MLVYTREIVVLGNYWVFIVVLGNYWAFIVVFNSKYRLSTWIIRSSD